jgi:DNA-binding NarL/FixJ family response regulator
LEHRGYLWKEVIASQLESVERLEWTLKTGGLAWNPMLGRYQESLVKTSQEFLREPHIVGVTRNIEHSRAGSWVGALFDYHPPRIGFSRAEQRLLLAALSGETDAKLAEDLGTTISTVKNTWRSIYNRVASRMPNLFPDRPHAEAQNSDRGREKRRQLLTYLRERPEELRPVLQKLLRQAANQPRRRSA